MKLAVNISPIQLKDPEFYGNIVQCLEATGFSPHRLELELKEAVVLDNSERTLRTLARLREIGVTIARDDFATGYSSLASLLRFPFDKIKIDRSFMQNGATSASAAAIVRAVVGIGANLDLLTTGEGVETHEQLALLRSCGCTEAQGYLFSQARPNSDVPDLLRRLADSPLGTLQVANVER